jgi:DNA replication protein DnaC
MNDFDNIISAMLVHGMKLPAPRIQINIPQARNVLRNTMAGFLKMEGRLMQWLPEYDEVASWLTDNKGRGLFLFGDCGRGKSLLCRYVLPAILLSHCQKVVSIYNMQEVNNDIDEVLSKRIISIDDVGTESVSIQFGRRRIAFAEIMDAAEKDNKLLIISSNLNADEILKYYDTRILDRLKSTTLRIPFEGQSLRK